MYEVIGVLDHIPLVVVSIEPTYTEGEGSPEMTGPEMTGGAVSEITGTGGGIGAGGPIDICDDTPLISLDVALPRPVQVSPSDEDEVAIEFVPEPTATHNPLLYARPAPPC